MKVERIDIKDEQLYHESDVLSARDRLKGALQDLVQHDEDETASSDDDSPSRYKHKRHGESPSRTKIKKRRLESSGNPFHHTYVMKLFDRSVDLAQFEEDTPLYPICRAWMTNQPRVPQSIIKRRMSSPEPDMHRTLLNGDEESSIADIHRLPPPVMEIVNRIPSPLPEQMDKKFSLDFFENRNPPSREQLLRSHRTRWNCVRRKWQEQAKKYEERYYRSTAVLTAIYNKAQENMV